MNFGLSLEEKRKKQWNKHLDEISLVNVFIWKMEIDCVGSYVTPRSYRSCRLWVCTWGFEKKQLLLNSSARLCPFAQFHRVCAQQRTVSEGSQAKPVPRLETAHPGFSFGSLRVFAFVALSIFSSCPQSRQSRLELGCVSLSLIRLLRGRASLAFCFHLPYMVSCGVRYSWKGPFHCFKHYCPPPSPEEN
jgi:hypothetical protein